MSNDAAITKRRSACALSADDHHPQPVERREGLCKFDEAGSMLPSSYYDRIVDVAEELVRLRAGQKQVWLTVKPGLSQQKRASTAGLANPD